MFMISNFRHVLNVVCFLLGNSPVYEFRYRGNYPEERIQHSEHGKSLKSRILHLYGEETARHIQLFEKLRIKKTKLLTSLTFLLHCRDHKTIPRFLQFHHHIHSKLPTESINAPVLPVLMCLQLFH